MPALGLRERSQHDQSANLGGVVVGHSGLEVLALRGRLAKLPTQPTEEAHRGLLGHSAD
jgi:hypothetical protein